jgi:hypothetical protein
LTAYNLIDYSFKDKGKNHKTTLSLLLYLRSLDFVTYEFFQSSKHCQPKVPQYQDAISGKQHLDVLNFLQSHKSIAIHYISNWINAFEFAFEEFIPFYRTH